jgi:hypothetical protein
MALPSFAIRLTLIERYSLPEHPLYVRGDPSVADIRFEASNPAAIALRPRLVQRHMPYLSSRVAGSPVQFAVQYQPAAHTRAQSQAYSIAAAPGRARLEFGERHDIGVIVDKNRQ